MLDEECTLKLLEAEIKKCQNTVVFRLYSCLFAMGLCLIIVSMFVFIIVVMHFVLTKSINDLGLGILFNSTMGMFSGTIPIIGARIIQNKKMPQYTTNIKEAKRQYMMLRG